MNDCCPYKDITVPMTAGRAECQISMASACHDVTRFRFSSASYQTHTSHILAQNTYYPHIYHILPLVSSLTSLKWYIIHILIYPHRVVRHPIMITAIHHKIFASTYMYLQTSVCWISQIRSMTSYWIHSELPNNSEPPYLVIFGLICIMLGSRAILKRLIWWYSG